MSNYKEYTDSLIKIAELSKTIKEDQNSIIRNKKYYNDIQKMNVDGRKFGRFNYTTGWGLWASQAQKIQVQTERKEIEEAKLAVTNSQIKKSDDEKAQKELKKLAKQKQKQKDIPERTNQYYVLREKQAIAAMQVRAEEKNIKQNEMAYNDLKHQRKNFNLRRYGHYDFWNLGGWWADAKKKNVVKNEQGVVKEAKKLIKDAKDRKNKAIAAARKFEKQAEAEENKGKNWWDLTCLSTKRFLTKSGQTIVGALNHHYKKRDDILDMMRKKGIITPDNHPIISKNKSNLANKNIKLASNKSKLANAESKGTELPNLDNKNIKLASNKSKNNKSNLANKNIKLASNKSKNNKSNTRNV